MVGGSHVPRAPAAQHKEAEPSLGAQSPGNSPPWSLTQDWMHGRWQSARLCCGKYTSQISRASRSGRFLPCSVHPLLVGRWSPSDGDSSWPGGHVWPVWTLAPEVWLRNDTVHLCPHFIGQAGHSGQGAPPNFKGGVGDKRSSTSGSGREAGTAKTECHYLRGGRAR